jgi:hypothetical protein
MFYRVQEGEITERRLPKTFFGPMLIQVQEYDEQGEPVGEPSEEYRDVWISNYDSLNDLEIYASHGFLPVENVEVEQPSEEHVIQEYVEEIFEDKIVRTPVWTIPIVPPMADMTHVEMDLILTILESNTSMSPSERLFFQKRFEDLYTELKIQEPEMASDFFNRYTGGV